MTRNSVNRTLSRLYWLLGIVLLLLLAAKFADDLPGVPAKSSNCRETLRIHARHVVADCDRRRRLSLNVFQKRSKFVESLEEEWRNIVRTKSAF